MSKKKCPFLGKACIEHDCMMWSHITMDDPQTGGVRDEFTCAIVLIPVMQIDTTRWTRGVQSSVDKARSEQQEAQHKFLELAEQSRKPLLNGG